MPDFCKFHGTGNDFILIDGRETKLRIDAKSIAALCNRHTGIGADGLIVVVPHKDCTFEMIYYNADGSPATMCGNGARCAAAFAFMNNIAGSECDFMAGDGRHEATIEKTSPNEWKVEITMRDVTAPAITGDSTEINTGTPHLVKIVEDAANTDVFTLGREIRYSEKYRKNGVNIDWMSYENDKLRVRTYEKGVENETLSCGTGVTACGIVAALNTGRYEWDVVTPGGMLSVKMVREGNLFTNIRLKGPATFVFSGDIASRNLDA
ncbi:MAG: diaminopimelate epimerase [Bacteroidales bacterium]|nr:diaminopimelate epimerase [Bacteroidales bacterium]